MAREDLIRKVRALFAKENAPGTTPEEVAAAIAKATRLLEREGLTRAALEIEGTSTEPIEDTRIFEVPLDGTHERKITWRIRLGSYLTKHFGCYCFTRGGAIMIVGKPSDADMVRYLFAYCASEIERISKVHCKGMGGKTYANNFKLGCTDAINDAISREKALERKAAQDAANTSTALVLVNNAIAAMDARATDAAKFAFSKLNITNAPKVQYRGDYGARQHGRNAGANIYPGTNRAKLSGGTKQLKD